MRRVNGSMPIETVKTNEDVGLWLTVVLVVMPAVAVAEIVAVVVVATIALIVALLVEAIVAAIVAAVVNLKSAAIRKMPPAAKK